LADSGLPYEEVVGKVADPKRQDQSQLAAATLCGGGGQWEEPEEAVIAEVRRDSAAQQAMQIVQRAGQQAAEAGHQATAKAS
jgi:hypothetical protein